MSNQENDKLIESAYEAFLNAYETDRSFCCYIQAHFFTDMENWRLKEYGHDEDALARVFDMLLSADYEYACRDIVSYALSFKTIKI